MYIVNVRQDAVTQNITRLVNLEIIFQMALVVGIDTTYLDLREMQRAIAWRFAKRVGSLSQVWQAFNHIAG